MKEEIFAVAAIISYENDQELQTIIGRYEKPLSLYVFSTRNDFIKKSSRNSRLEAEQSTIR
jgi:aldehyde dehydrogenase (NAD+)